VHTNLPFAYQTFGGEVDAIFDWNKMYVDQNRIVGIKAVRLSCPISILQAANLCS